MNERSIELKRAKAAYEAIEAVGRLNDQDEINDYVTEAKKMPVRILASGLGQAVAFIEAKSNNSKQGLKLLQKQMTDWIAFRFPLQGETKHHSLIERIINGDVYFLRRATDEALAWLQWLNRFAEAKDIKKK
ncbi:MAG: type III-B CRISPR module-associated protein Cmr5 [bacterium]|nr:type III-B CRISPR module-associated protein Cmr5 [bacterium]